MNVDQPTLSRPPEVKASPALPGSDMSGEPQNNTVMVEQEKFDAPLGRYIHLLGKKPFERDIITAHSRVKADLARLWPQTNDDGRQARRLWNMIDSVVQDMPQTTAQIFLRISTSRNPLLPTALPVPTEKAVLATFDTKENTLVRYDVPPDSDGAITADMGIPSGLMMLCQPLLPVANAFRDTRPVGMGPGAALFNVNEKDKPDMDVPDPVLNPPDTSSPGMRSPNLPPVPPYLTRIDYPYGIYVRDEGGGHPILKTVALGIAAESFFRHEKGILDKKFLAQQRLLQKKSDEERKHLAAIAGLTALQEEQKSDEGAKKRGRKIVDGQKKATQKGTRALSLLAKQEVAAQAELLQTGGQNAGQPQRPETATVVVPIAHLDTERPEGSQIFAVGIPKLGSTDTTQTMPIMPGASGPANAIPVNPVRLSIAELNTDTDRVEGEPEDGPENSNNDAVAQMAEASREILTPDNKDGTLVDQVGQHIVTSETASDQAGQHTVTSETAADQAGQHTVTSETAIDQAGQHTVTNETAADQAGQHTVTSETATDQAGEHIATSGYEKSEIAEAVEVREASPHQPEQAGSNYSPNESARNETTHNDAPRNEGSQQETNQQSQQPDQSSQQADKGNETGQNEAPDNRQENQNQSNEPRNENQGNENHADESRNNDPSHDESRSDPNRENRQESQQDSSREGSHDESRPDETHENRQESQQDSSREGSHDESRPDETHENRQESQQDSSREGSRDEARADRQDGSHQERNDSQDNARSNDVQESRSSRSDEERNSNRQNDDSDQSQNSSSSQHSILDSVELFHHHAIGHADIAHGIHSDVRNIGMDGGWVTMPSTHGLAAHTMAGQGAVPLGNTMLHTHKPALAATPHISAQGTIAAAASAAPASHGIASTLKMPSYSLGMLPFAVANGSASPTGFVTSQRNQEWQELKKQEAMKQNYVSPTPANGAVHPEVHVPHEDLTPDM